MKAIVYSGGGSKGAYSGGVTEHLINDDNKDYDLYVGTSTGALLLPFVAFRDIERLKEAYTEINQKDIWKVNPFKVDKKGEVSINTLNVLFNMGIRGKKSFGDASNLKKLIDKFLTEDIYNSIYKLGKNMVVCVTNSTTGEVEYKSSRTESYKDYKEWMLASATVPPFMEYVTKNGYQYSDGGMKDPIPIQHAIDLGATEVDVIILRKNGNNLKPSYIGNIFQSIVRTTEIMLDEVGTSDIAIGKLLADERDVKLNIFFTPEILTDNPLIFNRKEMRKWWDLGYHNAQTKHKITLKK